MGLKKCKECGQEVSTSAKACPKCGVASPAGGSSIVRAVLYGFGGLMFVSMCSTLMRKKDQPTTTASPEPTATSTATSATPTPAPAAPVQKPERVSAARIASDFDKNEAAAEDNYRDRCIDVTGTVDQIDAGLGSDVTLHLRAGVMGMAVNDVSREFAKTLSKGDTVQLSVKGIIEVLGMPVASYSRECNNISHAAAEQEAQQKATAAAEKKAKQAEAAAAAKSAKSSKPAPKAQAKERLELPCRPGEQPPCYQ